MKSPEFRQPITETIVDGKINWREWVLYPDGFTENTAKLIDKIAEFTKLAEFIHGTDKLEMFDTFISAAHRTGLINRDEWLAIEGEKHNAV
jgi:hypothetical protein